MTITATASEIAYQGDAVTVAFAIPFPFDTSADIKVVTTVEDEEPEVLSTGFSISGGSGSTGTCTFDVAPDADVTVTILDDPELTQTSDYASNDAFPAEAHESALDRSTRQIKRLHQVMGRSIRVADGDPSGGDDLLLPIASVRAGMYIAFDVDGNPVASAGTGGGDSALRDDLASTVAGSEGASLVGFRASAAGAVARSVRSKLRDICDLRDFGAVIDGVTDDTAAMVLLAASGEKQVSIPAGRIKITGSTAISAEQQWLMNGSIFVITGNTQVLTVADGVADFGVRGRWGIEGDNNAAGSLSGTGAGIVIIGGLRYHVDGPIAKSVKGWGVLVQPGASILNRAEHGVIHAPQAYGCYRGVEVQAGTGAEYVSITAVQAARCDIGAVIAAGNAVITGGSLSDNREGLLLSNGTNHAHGRIANVGFNHNTDFNVRCDNVTNGQSFDNCHAYGNPGSLFFDECLGIQWNLGIVNCPVYNYKGGSSGLNKIRGAWMPAGGAGFSREPGTNNGHDELIIEDCWGAGALDGSLTCNDVSDMHVYAARTGGGGTQALVSAVAADLVFNSEPFDRRAAYDNATGITTIPAAQTGVYRIRAHCLFGGTAMSATASYIEVQKNGASPGGSLFFPTIFDTTKLQIDVDFDLHLVAGDTVKLRATITGTTPTFGDAASDSFLSVERIA